MFFVINKKGILFGCLLAVFIALAVWIHAVQPEEEENVSAFALPITNKVVLIDPGHGGIDAGATDNGLVEKDLNLAIAQKLKAYVEQSGGIAVMTRDTDTGTYAPDRANGVSQKQSDLAERKKMAETYQADVFVSIHMNKFPQTQYKGAQVFYAKTPENSESLAESIQQSLKDVLQDGNERQAKPNERGVFILKDAKVPSVIVECGFLSNPEEAALLKEDGYQQKVAWAIYLGIVKFFV